MRIQAPATLLALVVLGCAGAPPPARAPSPAPVVLVPPEEAELVVPPFEVEVIPPPPGMVLLPPPPDAGAGVGARAVSVLGTPFYLVFKAATCVASAALAAPIAAVAGLTPEDDETIAVLGEGVARNCGPPYVLTPPAAAAPAAVE